jgi:hypothetical protein
MRREVRDRHTIRTTHKRQFQVDDGSDPGYRMPRTVTTTCPVRPLVSLSLTKQNSVGLNINHIHQASYVMGIGVKQPRGELNHSCPSGAEVKNKWGYTSNLPRDFTAYTATTSTASYKIFPAQLIKRFAELTETEGSSTCSQNPKMEPYKKSSP